MILHASIIVRKTHKAAIFYNTLRHLIMYTHHGTTNHWKNHSPRAIFMYLFFEEILEEVETAVEVDIGADVAGSRILLALP